MSALLSIEIVCQPLERIDAELAVAGFFSDQRPLRGPASRADWRLCGLVSEMIGQGKLNGRRGDAILLPSLDRLYAPRVLLLGLGQRSKFGLRAARTATREAVARALELRVESLALPPLGIAPDDFPRHATVVMEGALEALGAEGARQDHLRLRLGFESSQAGRASSALEAAAETRGVEHVALALPKRERGRRTA